MSTKIQIENLYTVEDLIDYLEMLRHDGLGNALVVPEGATVADMPGWNDDLAAELEELESRPLDPETAIRINALRRLRDSDDQVVFPHDLSVGY